MLSKYLYQYKRIAPSVLPLGKAESANSEKPPHRLKKSDFVLSPYMESSNLRATWQILNTVVPYVFLWVVAVHVASRYLWLLPPIIVLQILFSLRCFSLMHDCGHYALFRSRRINRLMGFLLGVINAMPYYGWARDHAYHHKTNGDWERYRGVADFLSTEEFLQLDPLRQKLYAGLRHPLMAIPGGFFYLAIKPRLILCLGIWDCVCYLFARRDDQTELTLIQKMSAHPSKYWHTATEFWDLLLNNICVFSGWIFFGHLWGIGLFWGIYSMVLSCSATIFIWIFFVQHIFEGAYAHRTEGWDYVLGAVQGSSWLNLPPMLRWFTADIGYHNIHHLSSRIPNYHLAACHDRNHHLLSGVKVLGIQDLLNCSRFLLWHPESGQLVSIAALLKAKARLDTDIPLRD
ncbi:MAG: fatty acid desaturase [Oscillatoriales cyanobacterium SM2_2_1]|nr:fatty acid desaturase [Oscillatoriales cyanobacterium SM2_2_1]